MSSFARTVVLALGAFALAACDSDEATGPSTTNAAERVVNTNTRTFLRLTESGSEVVQVTDPATSSQWDLAIERTAVTLNGGSAGPGGVAGTCLCRNQGLTLPQLLELGRAPAAERQRFDRITADSIPTDGARFVTDRFASAAGQFWRGAIGAAAVAEPDSAWMLRWGTVGGPLRFGKLRVVSLAGATAQTPGTVTIEYTLQPTSGNTEFPAVRSLQVPVAANAVAYIDLDTDRVVTENDAWDIAFNGWSLRTNSTAPGEAAVRNLRFGPGTTQTSNTFANANLAFARFAPAFVWRADTFEGVFAATPWYKYDSAINTVYPTFDVFLVRRGTAVWKVQFTGYFLPQGSDERRLTIRAERLRP